MNSEHVINPYNDKGISPFNSFIDNIPGLMIKDEWNMEIEKYIVNNNIQALYFNYVKGWIGNDFSFLSNLKSLLLLNIINTSSYGLSSISDLHILKYLSLNVHANELINFSKLNNLTHVYLNYWKKAESIFNCNSIKELYISNIKKDHIDKIQNLTNLVDLTIGSSNIDNINFIKIMPNLKRLKILDCRNVSDISALKNRNLELVRFEGSTKIYDYDVIGTIKGLKILNISDANIIKSIKFTQSLIELQGFSFAGAKTIVEDGDLTILTNLPNLSMLMFASRKHYTHKLIKKWNWDNLGIPDTLLKKT